MSTGVDVEFSQGQGSKKLSKGKTELRNGLHLGDWLILTKFRDYFKWETNGIFIYRS